MQEWMILLSINVFLAFYVVLLYFRWRRNVGKHMLKTEEDKLQIIQLEKMASLGTLSAGVAHEINNPLTYIITNLNLIGGYAAQIKEVKDVDDRDKKLQAVTESLTECLEGANRIKRIVQDLLSFSHNSRGKTRNIDVNELLDTTLRILENEIKYRADIVRDYKASVTLWGDANQISQVFLNIIVNAANALKRVNTTVRGVITVATRDDGQQIVIEISDTGSGIPAKTLPKIFDAFFTTSGGTGLGLYVSKNIIINHGGTITAANSPKGGAVFTVTLPLKGGLEPEKSTFSLKEKNA